jgi:nitric oxide dioxygenase
LAYARNIDQLQKMGPAVERIAQKHVGLQILPEHYPYVANALLAAIEDVLGEAATDEVLTAWGEAYWFLAQLLIGREAELYREIAAKPGGWMGWREFIVTEKSRESDVITSFVLCPLDGGRVVAHHPGQYLTFSLDVPGHGTQKRNYSISSAANDQSYRISVKREPGGIVSGWLHDQVEPGHVVNVAPPAGDFVLPAAVERPVVLLSGGVGLTPMVSMLEAIAATSPAATVQFVHASLDGSTHAMASHVRSLTDGHTRRSTVFYEAPREKDTLGRDFDAEGRITMDWLKQNTPINVADYFVCGPAGFLRTFVQGLIGAGVERDRIHYEHFGPADDVLAA